jgi:hypothetical protein
VEIEALASGPEDCPETSRVCTDQLVFDKCAKNTMGEAESLS